MCSNSGRHTYQFGNMTVSISARTDVPGYRVQIAGGYFAQQIVFCGAL